MKQFKSILWGIVLIAIGLVLGLNILEIINVNIFFDGWWTLFIIIPCFIDLFTDNKKTGDLIGLALGILLLLSCQEILDFSIVWSLFFPIILIIIGLTFVFKNTIQNETNKKIKKISEKSKDKKEYYATFSSQKINFDQEEFIGCEVSAVFGGIDIDLSDAIIKDDVVINATSIFGGINIIVPTDINVKVNSNSIFGGVDNKVKSKKENKVTIYINTTSIFGGVEVK